MKCSIPNCSNKRRGKLYCNKHELRVRRYGDPLATSPNRGKVVRWIKEASRFKGSECLVWPFSKDQNGYGQFRHPRYPRGAHRAMCYLVYGTPPTDKHKAVHSCNDRACVNPQHLSWRALRSGNTKLTEAAVREIRKAKGHAVGRALAEKFGVSRQLVNRIQNGTAWSWLKD